MLRTCYRLARAYIPPEVTSTGDDAGVVGSTIGANSSKTRKNSGDSGGGGVGGGVGFDDGAVSEADSDRTFIEVRSLNGDAEPDPHYHARAFDV